MKILSLSLIAGMIVFTGVSTVRGAERAPASQVTLDNVVVTRSLDPDSNGAYEFPVYADASYGEVVLNSHITIHISPNCANSAEMTDQKLWCSPNGDKSKRFAFGSVTSSETVENADPDEPVSDPTEVYHVTYNTSLVQLQGSGHSYTLVITEPKF